MGLAETHSSLAALHGSSEYEHEALRFLELMHETFPDRPKEDQNFAYTQSYGCLVLNCSIMASRLRDTASGRV